MQKLDMLTPDMVAQNMTAIAQLFPNIITEQEDADGNIIKAIDYDLFRQMFSRELVEGSEERYRLDWPGKRASILKANTPINKTLRPVVVDSVNWDTTENLYIEGDNFEVLKVLQESYLGKVKMIYIDPPYNTGEDFIYEDNFKISREEYEEGLEIVDEKGGRLVKNTDTNGRFHSDWLSMMYERLLIARDLLKEDGVIFMSINDKEVSNLRKIADDVFGESGFIDYICVINNLKGNQNDTYFKTAHENLLVYAKGKFKVGSFRLSEDERDEYELSDELGLYKQGAYFRKTGNVSLREERPHEYYPIYVNSKDEVSLIEIENSICVTPKTSDGRDGCWRWSKGKLKENLSELIVNRGGDGISFYIKQRLELEDGLRGKSAKTVFYKKEYNNGSGKSQIINLFGIDVFNSYPKSLSLIKDIIEVGVKDNDIILDFFSGSSTTAHAVMQLNAEDGANRKFIMVQIPEETSKDSEAHKAGYKNICEIGKERIRRAGKKIIEENKDKEGIENLDTGFRVYRLDSSNMKDVFYHPTQVTQAGLFDLTSNIKDDRTPEDILAQVMLDLGLTLDLPIETRTIASSTVFLVAGNSLVACFDEEVDFSIVDELARLNPLKVVFRDSSFQSDADRINFETRFKKLSPDSDLRVI